MEFVFHLQNRQSLTYAFLASADGKLHLYILLRKMSLTTHQSKQMYLLNFG